MNRRRAINGLQETVTRKDDNYIYIRVGNFTIPGFVVLFRIQAKPGGQSQDRNDLLTSRN